MGERSDIPARSRGPYSFEYSAEHALPRVLVPRGPNHIPEEGWLVTGEFGNENGDYYATLREDPIMTDEGPKRATKDIRKDVLEALNPGLIERLGRATPEEVGSIALIASEVAQPTETPVVVNAPESEVPVVVSEADEVSNQIDVLKQGLSDTDKTALWKFSVALHPYEEEAAIRTMSEELRANAGLRYQAQGLQRKLTKLRQTK